MSLAGLVARLRHQIAALDVDPLVNVGEIIRTEIRPWGSQSTTVVGRVVVTFDYEATEEQP